MQRSGGASSEKLVSEEDRELLRLLDAEEQLGKLRALIRGSVIQNRVVPSNGGVLRPGSGEVSPRLAAFYMIDSRKVEEVLGGVP